MVNWHVSRRMFLARTSPVWLTVQTTLDAAIWRRSAFALGRMPKRTALLLPHSP